MEAQISPILRFEKLLVAINLNPIYTRYFLTFYAFSVFLARIALLWCENNKQENSREREREREREIWVSR
jgi:hypothetical protein